MRRLSVAAALVVALITLTAAPLTAQDKDWGTIKGRITWDVKKAPAPKREPIKVPEGNRPACLIGKVLLDEQWMVHAKNHGIADVFLWLEPMQEGGKIPVHPDLKAIKHK